MTQTARFVLVFVAFLYVVGIVVAVPCYVYASPSQCSSCPGFGPPGDLNALVFNPNYNCGSNNDCRTSCNGCCTATCQVSDCIAPNVLKASVINCNSPSCACTEQNTNGDCGQRREVCDQCNPEYCCEQNCQQSFLSVCGGGQILVANAINVKCPSTGCTTQTCCVPAASCSAFTAGCTLTSQYLATTNTCGTSACSAAICCVNKGNCSTFTGLCLLGETKKTGATDFCAVGVCTIDDCCVLNEACTDVAVALCESVTGGGLRADAPIHCTASTCTYAECCETIGICSNFPNVCPTNWTPMTNPPSRCSTASCVHTECCSWTGSTTQPVVTDGVLSPFGTCSSTCQGGIKTRTCIPPTNGGVPCSGVLIMDCNASVPCGSASQYCDPTVNPYCASDGNLSNISSGTSFAILMIAVGTALLSMGALIFVVMNVKKNNAQQAAVWAAHEKHIQSLEQENRRLSVDNIAMKRRASQISQLQQINNNWGQNTSQMGGMGSNNDFNAHASQSRSSGMGGVSGAYGVETINVAPPPTGHRPSQNW